MTTEELDALWLRLVSEGKARWMPGMRAHEYGVICPDCVLFGLGPPDNDVHCPDWTDPATLGVLLGQVREAWGRPDITTCAGGERDGNLSWEVECIDAYFPLPECRSATEAEALLRALSGAP